MKTIEYIHCKTEADMVWKEIYYINLFHNSKSQNITDVYNGVTDIGLEDKWIKWRKNTCSNISDKFDCDEPEQLYKIFNSLKTPINTDFIHILQHDKLNHIGKDKYSLSQKWFRDNQNSDAIKTLSNNIVNYFINIAQGKAQDYMWTTFQNSKDLIKGKGFRKGFIPLNEETKDCSNKIYLAYLCNIFYPGHYHNKKICEETYATLKMLQFIWRSAIRDGKQIWIYIPSIRMRTLLESWISINKL